MMSGVGNGRESIRGKAVPGESMAVKTAEAHISVVAVGTGNAAFIVAPSGEVMLLDAGPGRAADRILAFMQQNGIHKIDYLVVSHFEEDHMGAAPIIAEKVPVRHFVDHAYTFPREFGEYFYGLSACSPAELYGLHPRAAILSLGALGHKHGTAEAMRTLHGVPGLDLWQTEFIREGGESGHNGPQAFIAHLGGKTDKAPFIGLAAKSDGSFAVTNSRNGFTKHYPGGGVKP